MKLKENFIVHETSEGQVMVSTGNIPFTGIVRNNKTAAFIVEKLEKEVTEIEIIEAMLQKYDVSKEIVEDDVKRVLKLLREIGAIDETEIYNYNKL